jgi:two-component system phosphate regulon sensor histidine kinase PhoR
MTVRFHRWIGLSTFLIVLPAVVVVGGDGARSGAALILGALLAAILGLLLQRVVAAPLEELIEMLRGIAAGTSPSPLRVRGIGGILELLQAGNAALRGVESREGALRAETLRMESFIRGIGEGILVIDSARRVTLGNRAVENLLGTSRGLTGKTTMELFRSPDLEAHVGAALEGRHPPALDLAVGGERSARVQATPVDDPGGAVDSAVLVFQDRTEARQVESMRRDFVANVSHEFKTPLAAIRGYAETLREGAIDDRKTALEFIEGVEANTLYLQALVGDLLELARLESELPAVLEPVAVKALLNDLVARRAGLLERQRIRVTIACPEILVVADRSRLTAALSNLIDNAAHYNRSPGEIHIEGIREGNMFSIAVADTGEGIPAADLPRIFERFYRVDRSRTRGSGRTGLGLAIARHAVESQGGTIAVSSTLGTGSTFTIALPVREPEHA